MDKGSENSKVAEFQIAFRMTHADRLAAEHSVRYTARHLPILYVQMYCNEDCGNHYKCTCSVWSPGGRGLEH